MMSNFDLIAYIERSYDSELLENNNSPLKKGSFQKSGDKISFLTRQGEPLVLNFDSKHVDIAEFFNHSVIHLNNNDLLKFKKNIYSFADKSKNKEYFNAVAKLIEKTI